MKFLNPNRLRFNTLVSDVKTYLINTYDQTKNVFTKASPFGQILVVVQEYYQLVLLYLEDALVELNINTAQKQKSIFGLSRLAGHNPTRSLSAQGTLNIKISPSAKGDVNASYIMILDKTKLICKNNSFNYFIQLGNALDNIKIDINETKQIPIKVIQGEIEEQTVSGTGLPLQSYTMTSKKSIENEMVWVYVNGEAFEIVDSLYDMRKDENLCMVKTGISGGIDVYFGNEDYGVIPPKGSSIMVRYVKSDGFSGNIFSKSNQVNWKWDESAFTNTGEEVDMNEIFITSIEKPIILGADPESLELTKIIAPKTSRSYVLANTDNYVSLLSRFNYAYVDAYTTFDDDYLDDDNIVYLFLIPDIIRRLSKNTDYYTTPETNFYLDTDEKAALTSYINKSGQQIMSSEVSIVDPIITKYALNIFLRVYDSVDPVQIQNEVTSKTTEYLLGLSILSATISSAKLSMLNLYSGITHLLAEPAIVGNIAVKPAYLPKTSITKKRSCDPAEVLSVLVIFIVLVIQVLKPIQ